MIVGNTLDFSKIRAESYLSGDSSTRTYPVRVVGTTFNLSKMEADDLTSKA